MTHLDDPQLRAKLIKAGSDMPHVDVWARIHDAAAEIAEEAQARAQRRLSLFTALRLFAPVFAVILVVAASLVTLDGFQVRRGLPAAQSTVTASVPVAAVANDALERRLSQSEARVNGYFENGVNGLAPELVYARLAYTDLSHDDLRNQILTDRRAALESRHAPAPLPPRPFGGTILD